MSRTAAVLIVLVFLASILAIPVNPVSAASPDSWTAKTPMREARGGLGVAVVNGKIYAIGGSTASGPYRPDAFAGDFVGTNEEYDPTTDTWTTKASMPTPRDYFAIAAYKNKIYCIGGAVGFSVDEVSGFHSYVTSGVTEVYDTITNTWVAKKSMPDDGMQIQAHVVDGKIFVMDWSLVYVYDPEKDSWSEKTRMPPPYPWSSPVSAVVGKKIVVTGEFRVGWNYTSAQKVMVYDTETDGWSEGETGPVLVVNDAAVATAGVNALQRIYVLGLNAGQYPAPSTNQVYDPEANAWTAATAMPTFRVDFGVAEVNDVLYAIGGYSYTSGIHGTVTPTAVNEQYFPLGYGVPPEINVVSPVNQKYNGSSVSLIFTVGKQVSWVGYSLDWVENVTVAGNATLAGLSNGLHSVVVYANDTFGNMGASEIVSFTVAVPEPFPTTLVIVSAIAVVLVGLGLLIYFKKARKNFA